MGFGISRIREGLEQGDPWQVLKGLNERILDERRLGLQRIVSLDDITSFHIENDYDLARLLGHTHNSPQDLKAVLVERGVLSRDLRSYTAPQQEYIIHEALEGDRLGRPRSVYFCDVKGMPLGGDVPADLVERNRRRMVRSKSFEVHMGAMGIYSLDHVTARSTRGLDALGVAQGQADEFKGALRRYAGFHADLREYAPAERAGIAEHIAEAIIFRRGGNNWKSSYFGEALSQAALEANRNAILSTKTARGFIAQMAEREDGASHLRKFFGKLGYAQGSVPEMREIVAAR